MQITDFTVRFRCGTTRNTARVILFLLAGSLTAETGVASQRVSDPDRLSRRVSSPAAAAEPDARLQADGQGWRLDRAKITDPKRPRVLLIGDSILNGYLKTVLAALKDKVYVDAWINPYHQASGRLHEMLGEVLDNGPYDVIHVNMGLHGWAKGRIPEGQFEPLTNAYIDAIRIRAPGSAIIWATSTPVTRKGRSGEFDPDINPIVLEQNRLAVKVMKEMNVPVNDLPALLAGRLDLARGDQFHWTAPAYEILGDAVANAVLHALKIRPAGAGRK